MIRCKRLSRRRSVFKRLHLDKSATNIEGYKIAKRAAKRAVSVAKGQAYDNLYQRLGTKEGEKDIYRMARIRERKTRDINQIKCIKDGVDRLLVRDEEIKDRWREYFDKLFNGEEEGPILELDDSFDDNNRRFVRRIQETEIEEALKRMKSGKAMGPDGIPIEVNIIEELEDGEQNMFVHHDVPLPDFPLCTAWMDFNLKGEDRGNFIAVGTMGPAIEIWDLDMVDELQPHMVLGGLSKKKKKAKGKKGKKYKKGSHKSSVLGLAWNKEVRNVLASASADTTVKIWDLAVGKCAVTLEHHDDKAMTNTYFLCLVQAVCWSHQSPEVLVSGSFDKTVAMSDMKDGGQSYHKWSVDADVESLAWDPHNDHMFVVSLENGMVQAFDKRTASTNSPSRSTCTLHAHEKAVSTISFCPSAPNLLATGSTDKMDNSDFTVVQKTSCGVSKRKGIGLVKIPYLVPLVLAGRVVDKHHSGEETRTGKKDATRQRVLVAAFDWDISGLLPGPSINDRQGSNKGLASK
ncbi:hypothetical protein PR202_gb10138 [Eleusine coracana subsp. coracana]|uniref:Uncharacterized protein n=1 Tax=Eleusine coracana subsp. coracana TaxID=191504 RepID=A0AAV5EJC3_ELECO|nr:hypothetical protein PR202_gb10138 [Eleusine coracana subsp. coracana]